MTKLPEDSVLDPVVHARLLLDIDHVCETANIPPMYLHRRMAPYCRDHEIAWVKGYPQAKIEGKIAGYRLIGKNSEPRCMAICGAFLRNFIDARVVTLNKLIDDAQKGEAPDPTVMIIPNLFVATQGGKPLTAWQVSLLYDVLLARMVSGRMTVVYVEDMDALANAYGALMREHLLTHFVSEEQLEAHA
jgi:hypothetical protein